MLGAQTESQKQQVGCVRSHFLDGRPSRTAFGSLELMAVRFANVQDARNMEHLLEMSRSFETPYL